MLICLICSLKSIMVRVSNKNYNFISKQEYKGAFI